MPQARTTLKIILCVIAALIASVALSLPQYFREIRSARWPSTSGIITESYLSVGYIKHFQGFTPEIHYRYQVGGTDMLGAQVTFHLHQHVYARDVAESWIRAYPTGKLVSVYYSPTDPTQAVLEPGIQREEHALLYMGFGLLVFFSALFVFLLYGYRRWPTRLRQPN